MTLHQALESKDFKLATQLAKSLCNSHIIQALNDTFVLQNLHAYWLALDFWLLLDEKNIVSLDLLKNMGDEEEVDFNNIDIESLINSTTEKPKLKVDQKKSFPLLILENELRYFEHKSEEECAILVKFINACRNLNAKGGKLLTQALSPNTPLSILDALIEKGCDPMYENNAQQNFLFNIVKWRKQVDIDTFKKYLTYFIDQGLDINHRDVIDETPIIALIKSGEATQRIDVMIELGADIHIQKTDIDGFDLLEIAVTSYNPDFVSALLKHGLAFDYEKQDREGHSVLFRFTDHGVRKDQLTLFSLLLQGQPDLYQINHDSRCEKHYSTPMENLVTEAHPDALKLALAMLRPDINQTDEEGNTPLHLAASNYVHEAARAVVNLERIKILIAYGADVNTLNNKEQTPAACASDDDKKADILAFLLAKEHQAK